MGYEHEIEIDTPNAMAIVHAIRRFMLSGGDASKSRCDFFPYASRRATDAVICNNTRSIATARWGMGFEWDGMRWVS